MLIFSILMVLSALFGDDVLCLCATLEQIVLLQGVSDGVDFVLGFEFRGGSVQVGFDGAFCNAEALGDGGDVVAIGEVFKAFDFSLAKRVGHVLPVLFVYACY